MVIRKQEPFKLTPLEQMGKDYEELTKTLLISNGFGKYVIYSNPSNPLEWKRY